MCTGLDMIGMYESVLDGIEEGVREKVLEDVFKGSIREKRPR